MNKNLPLGAEHDPRAPYNELKRKTKIVDLQVTLTVSKYVTVEVFKKASNKEIYSAINSMVQDSFNSIDWEISDIDWEEN